MCMIYKGYNYYIKNSEETESGDSIIDIGKPEKSEDTTEEKNTGGQNDTTEGGLLIATKGDADSTEEDGVTTETGTPDGGSSSKDKPDLAMIFGITSAVLLLVVIYLASMLAKLKGKNNASAGDEEGSGNFGDSDNINNVDNAGSDPSRFAPTFAPVESVSKSAEEKIGKLHNIGRRKGQQDSLGLTEYNGGTLAIVADGMGGLADGDRVSQKIVMTLLQDSASIAGASRDNRLYEMVSHANREVNQMLGPEGLYKSGSTLLAVMAESDGFHWVAVGDSHIYLFRAGTLLLMNREHIYEAELVQKAINGENTFADVKTNPKKDGLTSFIGMGNLKYIDGSMEKVTYAPGDWILLMSDGVFNTVPEPDMCRLLNEAPSAKVAAERLEQEVLRRQNPKQDNFTAIIMEL